MTILYIRISQMKNAAGYVKQKLGQDIPAVLIDGDSYMLHITSNRPLDDYEKINGVYVRVFYKSDLGEDAFRCLGSDSRFINPFRMSFDGRIEVGEPRNSAEYEKKVGFDRFYREGTGYGKVACRKLWFSLFGEHDELDFPEDSTLVHEMTHGVNIWHHDTIQKYGIPRVVDEALACYLELKYLEQFYPSDARRWVISREDADTDDTHMKAFRHVLDNSLAFEEILEKVKNAGCEW